MLEFSWVTELEIRDTFGKEICKCTIGVVYLQVIIQKLRVACFVFLLDIFHRIFVESITTV